MYLYYTHVREHGLRRVTRRRDIELEVSFSNQDTQIEESGPLNTILTGCQGRQQSVLSKVTETDKKVILDLKEVLVVQKEHD